MIDIDLNQCRLEWMQMPNWVNMRLCTHFTIFFTSLANVDSSRWLMSILVNADLSECNCLFEWMQFCTHHSTPSLHILSQNILVLSPQDQQRLITRTAVDINVRHPALHFFNLWVQTGLSSCHRISGAWSDHQWQLWLFMTTLIINGCCDDQWQLWWSRTALITNDAANDWGNV